ncbi:MAG: YhcH/YjgK/YiaL family protein [Dialister sp.]|nr:YhcH/YjgK/YiaL family protein [Dialister sp.]
MIFGNANYLSDYKDQIPDLIYDCLRKIKAIDFDEIEDGTYQINGYNMSVESPVTESAAERKLEGHKKFVDVVYEIDVREEIIGCRSFRGVGEETESYPERDLYFYKSEGNESKIFLRTGDFIVCYPADLHRPLCCSKKGTQKIRKAVLKLPVDELT